MQLASDSESQQPFINFQWSAEDENEDEDKDEEYDDTILGDWVPGFPHPYSMYRCTFLRAMASWCCWKLSFIRITYANLQLMLWWITWKLFGL